MAPGLLCVPGLLCPHHHRPPPALLCAFCVLRPCFPCLRPASPRSGCCARLRPPLLCALPPSGRERMIKERKITVDGNKTGEKVAENGEKWNKCKHLFAIKNKTEEKCLNYFQLTIENCKKIWYNKEKRSSAPTDDLGIQMNINRAPTRNGRRTPHCILKL